MGDSDLRQAWRALARAPGVTAVIVLSLAVGIGVNAAVFSWIQALVFRPLPGVANAASVYMVEPRTEGNLRPGASWLEYLDLAPRLGALRELAAFRMVPFNVGERTRNERTYGLLVSGNYFTALGLAAERGRLIRPEDAARPGAEPVAVVSHAFWQTRLGGADDVVGTTLRVNDRDLRVIGVTGERFQGTVLGLQFDVWVPATMAPELFPGSRELEDRGARGYFMLGRLPAAATAAQAGGEAAAAMQALAVAYPASNTGITAEVLPYWRASRGPQEMVLQALTILQGVMLLLLVAVCANAANLLLARASTRQREVGVRLAIGARPGRIVRLLLTEHLLMALLAAVLGIVIAYWGSQALRAGQMLSTAFPVRFQSGVDGWTLAFAVGLAVVCALAFGTVPGAAPGPGRAGARPATGGGGAPARGVVRNALMAVQVAVALMVLLVAGLFLRSMQDTRDIDPGFRREGLLLVAYDLSGRNADGAAGREFASRLLERLGGLPGVEAAAVASSVPLDIHGLPMRAFTLEGRARTDGAPDRTRSNVVTPGYFQAMGIPIVAGRDFAAMRDQAAPRQVLVNEAFVQTFVPAARRSAAGSGTTSANTSSPGSSAPRSTTPSTRARRRASTSRTAIGRRSPARCTWLPGPGPRRHWPTTCGGWCASWIRRCRSTTCGRWSITSTPACSCARCRHGCSRCSARCCWCWPRSVSTRSSPTRSRTAPSRSACGWRWARPAPAWSARSSARPCG